MGTPFLAELKIISWNFAPQGWAFCNGQLLPINQNQALFSLLGTTYGGNGQTTFGLPDLRGRTPMHTGQGLQQGQAGGEESHTLTASELASHAHGAQVVSATSEIADQLAPGASNRLSQPAASFGDAYAGPASALAATETVANAGGSQPHPNMAPYLVLNFVIALQGIFPSRN